MLKTVKAKKFDQHTSHNVIYSETEGVHLESPTVRTWKPISCKAPPFLVLACSAHHIRNGTTLGVATLSYTKGMFDNVVEASLAC
jgi:hypothetical protein